MGLDDSVDVDDIEMLGRRFEQLTVSRYRDRDKMREASDAIDELRKKVGGVSLSEKVRNFRDDRYADSS